MANLTISIDDALLERARLRATEQGTSVDAVLLEYLENWASAASAREDAVHGLLEIARASRASSEGRRWTRDELYDR